VAVLLAFPGVAAAWVGLESSSSAFGGTLAARLSAFTTLFVALSGTAAYLHAVPRLFSVDQEKVHLLGTEDVWALLLVISILNLGWIAYSWFRKSLLYTTVLARSDPNVTMFREHIHSAEDLDPA
jgi:hypothetical protein